MRLILAGVLTLAFSGGCTVGRLRERTVHQGGSVPDLQYRQVLDNLALFAGNPASLPWHVNLREGTAQITDSLTGGLLIDTSAPDGLLPQLFGSRTAVAQWGMAPVVDATELRLIRFAYRRARGIDEMPSPEFLDELAHELKGQLIPNADIQDESAFFYGLQSRENPTLAGFSARVVTTNTPDIIGRGNLPAEEVSPVARDIRRQVEGIVRDLAAIQPGWFHTGSRRDVPRDACFVGQSGGCYAWVGPEGREALTEFTLTILKFSNLIRETPSLNAPGSVKFSPGDARGG